MEQIIFLYIFFNGCVCTSWLWDTKDHFIEKFITIIYGFVIGWFITPLLIGRDIKQIMDE